MLIGFDIDGVLFPWDDAARYALVAEFSIPRPGPSTTWSYLKEIIEPAQWDWLWSHAGQDAVFGQVGRTYTRSVDAVNALLKAGHRVHFVTHRDPRKTAIHTATFLRLHFGRHPWAGIHVVQNDVAKRRLQPWDVFVDDKPETVHDFLGNTSAMVFAPVRPWNVDELGDINDPHLFHHYDDPTDVVRWVAARS